MGKLIVTRKIEGDHQKVLFKDIDVNGLFVLAGCIAVRISAKDKQNTFWLETCQIAHFADNTEVFRASGELTWYPE